jgi:hypothetical protein
MAIAALEFGVPSDPPSPPQAGKKLFLGADGKFRVVSPDGAITVLASGGTATTYAPSAPADPEEGTRWVDTTTFRAYEYVGGAWIEIVS